MAFLPLRIGIAGCGAVADVHARAIQGSQETELVSVFSRSMANAERLGKPYEVTYTDEWERFIGNSEMDAVSVCTPNGTHLNYGRAAAEAGKHVIVEKPLEVSLARGRDLIATCHDCRVHLAVIFQNRFIPAVQDMKRRIDAGELGKLFLGDAVVKWHRSQAYYDSAAWRGTFALDGGGVLVNQAIHTIDLLVWMMGDAESVFGHVGRFTHERMEGEDAAAAVLRFKSGALGMIEASTSVVPAQDRRLSIHGEKGTAVLEGDGVQFFDKNGVPTEDENKKPIQGGGAASPMSGFPLAPHRAQFDAIARAIRIGQSPPLSGDEALRSSAVVQAVYASADRHMPVDMATVLE